LEASGAGWSSWEAHGNSFEDATDSGGRAIKPVEISVETQRLTGQPEYQVTQEPRLIRDVLFLGLLYTKFGPENHIYRDIPENQIEIFADPFENIFKYDLRERFSAIEVLDHVWFKM
jgi:hypothetical protein